MSDAAFATLDQIPGVNQVGAATDAALGYLIGQGSQAPTFGARYQQNLQANLARLNSIPAALRVPAGMVGNTAAAITGGGVIGVGADALASAIPAVAPTLNALSSLPSILRFAGAGAAQGAVQGASDAPTNAGILPGAAEGAGLGAVAGAVLPAVGQAVGGGARMAANYVRPFLGHTNALTDAAGNAMLRQNGQPIMATAGQIQMAGRHLVDSADDPDAVRASLAGGANEIVPGSTPTTFQQTGDMGLGGVERAVATRNRGVFNKAIANQNSARLASLGSFQGTGDPSQVRDLVRAHLDAIDKTVSDLQGQAPGASARVAQAGEGRVATARGQANQAASAIGGRDTPEAYGAAMRARPDAAEQAAREQESALWDAVDPEGKLVMDVTPIRKEARAITGEQTKSAKPFSSAENQIYGAASSYRAGEPFKEVSDLRQNINDAISRELEHGRTPGYARLSRFKAVLDHAIDSAVERHAQREALAVAEGRMRPGDTMAARLQEKNDGWAAGTANSSGGQGQDSRSAFTEPSRSRGADGLSGLGGTGSSSGRRPGNAGGNPGLAAGSANQRPGPSLLAFLTQRGGVTDPGGDLAAMDAGPQRVGLLRRTGGQSLDYAREAAVEAGYLRPGASTNDLLEAIRSELAGRKVYPPEQQAGLDLASNTEREAARQSDAMMGAREDVRMAADNAGVRLAPAETDHATDLVMRGMDPHDAVDHAVRYGDQAALTRDTSLQQMGPAGVRPEAEQGLLTMPEPPAGHDGGPRVNFDEDAASRLRAAVDFSNDRHQRFNVGAVGDMVRRSSQGGFVRSDASVPQGILRPGAKGREVLNAYENAGGDMNAARDALAMQARLKAIKPDGTLNPDALSRFRRDYGRALSHPAMHSLNQALSTAEGAERAVGDAATRAKEALIAHDQQAAAQILNAQQVGRQFRSTVAGQFAKADAPDDVVRQVGALFSNSNATSRFAQLAALTKGNQAAIDGVRRAIVQHMEMRLVSNTEAGTSSQGKISADAFQTFMRQNRSALRQFFTENEVNTMDLIGKDIQRSLRSRDAIRLAGESNTAGDQEDARKFTLASRIGKAFVVQALSGGTLGILGGESGALTGEIFGVGAAVARDVLASMRLAGINKVDDLVTEAMLHPEVARILMSKVTPENQSRILCGLSHAVTRASASNLAVQANETGYNEPAPSAAWVPPAAQMNVLSTLTR
ncbi:hypothetical protein [Acidisoma silvae]|uniref:Uncharacterized protein n=1 Tax=Acidisoma silvae TaxID=2802396 RepID=A0A964E1I6_9PROT|nr:hypothetical protein [Acidisoma silvae]MCB8878282.1 hypothetical protein [Acidisoma silvae]